MKGLVRLMALGGLVVGVAIAACAASRSVGALACWYTLGGAGACVMQLARGAHLQLTAPEHSRGRALANYNAVTRLANVTALGLGGVLLDTAGPRGTFLIAGLSSAVIALCALAPGLTATATRGRRTYPHPTGAPPTPAATAPSRPTPTSA